MCSLSALFFRKAKVLEMLGETEEVQNKTLENLSKFCDYAENYTKGKTFNKWNSEVGRNINYVGKNMTHKNSILAFLLFIKYL